MLKTDIEAKSKLLQEELLANPVIVNNCRILIKLIMIYIIFDI